MLLFNFEASKNDSYMLKHNNLMRAKDINFSGEEIKGFKLVKLIGQGTWSDVYLAKDVVTQKNFAIKITSGKKFKQVPKLRELVQSEINILRSCNNPNVVKLIESFLYKGHQFIVLEYCNGIDLGELITKEKKIDELKAVEYLKYILNGFKGLHEVRAMHRDFKAENVMLNYGICKIVDLGCGKQLIVEGEVAYSKLGSYLTMAPQVIQGLPYGFKADIWSIGVVYYQMLYGTFPFQKETVKELLEIERRHQYNLQGQHISEVSKDFIKRCLVFNPQERISWQQIYHHNLIVSKRQKIYFGPSISQVSIEQNTSFYQNYFGSRISSDQSASLISQERSLNPSLSRKTEEEQYSKIQSFNLMHYKEQKDIPQLSLEQIQQEKQQENDDVLMPNQSILQVQLENNSKIRRDKCIERVRQLYQRKIENIKYMSSFVENQMKLFNNKEFTIELLLPIVCLLQKQSFLQLTKLRQDCIFLRNTFEISQQQFEIYTMQDNLFPLTIDLQWNNAKNVFENYKYHLQSANIKKDLIMMKKIDNQHIDQKQWSTFFNKSIKQFINSTYGLLNTLEADDFKRLLTISFCLNSYLQNYSSGQFDKQVINNTLSKLEHVIARKDEHRQIKPSHVGDNKQQSFKKLKPMKKMGPELRFFSSCSYTFI